VPLLIGATGSRGYAGALAGGYQPAMIVMAGLCVAAAVITAVFVTDDRRPGRPAGHRLVPRAPENGCPPPVAAPTPVLAPMPQEES
jgi:hypothetical protein